MALAIMLGASLAPAGQTDNPILRIRSEDALQHYLHTNPPGHRRWINYRHLPDSDSCVDWCLARTDWADSPWLNWTQNLPVTKRARSSSYSTPNPICPPFTHAPSI